MNSRISSLLSPLKGKASYLRRAAACISVLLAAVMTVYIIYQTRLLSYGFTDRKVVRIDYAVYSGEAFTSEPAAAVQFDSEGIQKTVSAANRQEVRLFASRPTSEVLFIYFEDGSMLNAFVSGDLLGIDYGRVWVSAGGLNEYIKSLLPAPDAEENESI